MFISGDDLKKVMLKKFDIQVDAFLMKSDNRKLAYVASVNQGNKILDSIKDYYFVESKFIYMQFIYKVYIIDLIIIVVYINFIIHLTVYHIVKVRKKEIISITINISYLGYIK